MNDPTTFTCSVIVPIFNEEGSLEPLYHRLTKVFDAIHVPCEIIFIDDGSVDGSLSVLRALADRDERVKYLSFSRNFGHEIATTAGIDHCTGDVVVLIDADLQDPPEFIPALIDKWREGYKIVYAQRKVRKGETLAKRLSAWLFYRVLQKLSEVTIPLDTGDFRLMDRKVIQSLRLFRENNRFMRGLVAWVGFEQTGVEYERCERLAGETKYSFWKLMILSVDAILGFSILPLRLASLIGILTMFFSLLLALKALIPTLTGRGNPPGYTLATVGLFLLFGINMFLLGILGEYVGRIYRQVQNRPLYLIKESRRVAGNGPQGSCPPHRD